MKQLKQLIAHPMPALANRYVIKLNLFHLETFLVSLRLATIAVVSCHFLRYRKPKFENPHLAVIVTLSSGNAQLVLILKKKKKERTDITTTNSLKTFGRFGVG